MEHWPLWLLRRRQKLLHHLLVPMHHLRTDIGDFGQSGNIMRHELRDLYADPLPDFVRMPLFLLLTNQTATRIRVEGRSVQ
ncbi:hypothetical protein BT93_B1045 [Corymbia citriodora subsp. variegata]|nr:hypothetical protein BT93_B1045 [Corymbia citriodora subsp. variegata]